MALEPAVHEQAKPNWGPDGSNINITSYTSEANPYTIPYDGYILLIPSANATIRADTINGGLVAFQASNNIYNSFFVKKGMKFTIVGTGSAYFRGIAPY